MGCIAYHAVHPTMIVIGSVCWPLGYAGIERKPQLSLEESLMVDSYFFREVVCRFLRKSCYYVQIFESSFSFFFSYRVLGSICWETMHKGGDNAKLC